VGLQVVGHGIEDLFRDWNFAQSALGPLGKPHREDPRPIDHALGEPYKAAKPCEQILQIDGMRRLRVPQPMPVGRGLERAGPEAKRSQLEAQKPLGYRFPGSPSRTDIGAETST
jgi:hypothetical protein